MMPRLSLLLLQKLSARVAVNQTIYTELAIATDVYLEVSVANSRPLKHKLQFLCRIGTERLTGLALLHLHRDIPRRAPQKAILRSAVDHDGDHTYLQSAHARNKLIAHVLNTPFAQILETPLQMIRVISPAAVSNTVCAVQCAERSQIIAVSEYLKCTWSSLT